MRLPTWDELIDPQKDVLEYPLDQPLFVAGPPGSGKTVLAVVRAQGAAAVPQDVSLVTYNRMLRRLVSLLNQSKPLARTMHSFAWRDYVARTNGRPPSRDPFDSFDYDWDAMCTALSAPGAAVPTRGHLVIDEGQDLPAGFFRYARYVAGALTVFADDDQALGSQRTTLEQIQAAAGLPDPIILSANFRNTPEIAALAEHFHRGRLPAATVKRASLRELPRLVSVADASAGCDLIARWSATRGGTIGVVASSNAMVLAIHRQLKTVLPDRRVDLYTSTLKNEDDIALLDQGITVLNVDSVKGQEFDSVFLLELEDLVPCTNDQMCRAMYMLCTRARDSLFLLHWPGSLSNAASLALPGPAVLERA